MERQGQVQGSTMSSLAHQQITGESLGKSFPSSEGSNPIIGFGKLAHNSILEKLKTVSIDEIATKNLISVTQDVNLEEAVTKMAENFLHSLPVWDSQQNLCIGAVDLLDIASFIVACVSEKDPTQQTSLPPFNRDLLRKETVKRVMNFSGRAPFVVFDVSGGTMPIFDMLSRGIHRVLVQNRSGDIYATVSQFDVVSKIHQLRYEKDVAKMLNSISVKDLFQSQGLGNQILGTGQRSLVFASADTPVFEVVKLLSSKGVTSVPIISESTGALTANFSVSDIRGLFQEKKWSKPVEKFLYKYSRPSLTPYVLDWEQNLGKVIQIFVDNQLHHLWIIEKGTSKPVGCVSLTDILRTIREYQEEHDVAKR